MTTVGISPKGQILIPKTLRDKYGFEPGVKIVIEETKNGLLIKPITREYITSMRGILKGQGPSFEERMRWKQEDLDKEDRS